MEGRETASAGAEAICALHSDRAATGTCERCGDYVCDECTDSGRFALCASCRDRTGLGDFPLNRETTGFASVFSLAWRAFSEHWAILCGGSTIWWVTSLFLSLFRDLERAVTQELPPLIAVTLGMALSIAQQGVLGVLMLGLIAMSNSALTGRPPALLELIAHAKRLLAYLVQFFALAGVVIVPAVIIFFVSATFAALDAEPLILVTVAVLTTLAVLVPTLYVLLGIGFAQYELVHDGSVGAIEALRRSWKIASGHRLLILGVWIASVALLMLSIFACCIGVIPMMAYFYLVTTALYRGLRNGTGLPEPAISP